MDKETPITKYLATLERRQAQMGMLLGSPPPDGVSPESRSPVNIRQRLRFEDETFLQPHNQSLFHFSPPSSHTVAFRTSNTIFRSGSGSNILSQLRSSNANSIEKQKMQPTAICEEEESSITKMSYKRKRYSFEPEWEEKAQNEKKMSEMERLLRQTQADLVEARSLATKLEHQKLELKRIHGEKIIQLEKSQTEMKIRCRDAVDEAEELKKELERAVRKNEEISEKFHKQAESHAEQKALLESKMSKFQTENVELKQKFDEDTLNQSGSMKQISTDLEESEKGAEKWVIDCQILQDQLTLKETQLAKYQQDLKDAQSVVLKYEELKNKIGDLDSSESRVLLLQENVIKFENLYAKQKNENNKLTSTMAKLSEENNILKSSMKREMLLEEQITTLENEVKLLRDFLNKKADVEADRDSYKEKLISWTTVAGKFDPECNAAHKFEAYVRQMQNTVLEMKHDNTNMKCTIESQNTSNMKMQSALANLQQENKTIKEENEKLSTELKQTSRRLLLVTMDRDGLKALKESYEQELEGVISAALKDRVIQLEELIAEYEKIIHEDPSTRKSCGECEKRMALLSELRSEIEKLKNEREMAASVAPDMTMSDDGNTTGVKIVALKMNPSTLSMDVRIKELIAENERLTQKLKQYDEQSMLLPVDPSVVEEKKKLEEQLRTLERKHEILTEAYNYETQQLQTALNKLFGFHVTLIREPQSQFRLQSIYSQNPDEIFIFQEAENTDMMLLETPVLDHFRDDIDRFLLREGSIPAFLSSATITFCQAQYQQQSVDASDLPSSQQSEPEQDQGEVTVDTTRTVQVEIEGQSDNENSEGEEEQAEEEEEEYDENEDERELPEDYDDEESENDPDDDDHHDNPDNHGDSDGEVVCIESD